MKAVFISYNQAHTLEVNAALDRLGIEGFTRWALTEGRGSEGGEPHYGTHAWPSMNSSVMAVVEDATVDDLLAELRRIDDAAPMQGLRAFVLPAERGM